MLTWLNNDKSASFGIREIANIRTYYFNYYWYVAMRFLLQIYFVTFYTKKTYSSVLMLALLGWPSLQRKNLRALVLPKEFMLLKKTLYLKPLMLTVH